MVRRPTLYVALLVLIASLAACAGAPVMQVKPGEFDFGDIPAAGPVSTILQVSNQGNADLQITNISTSCGCTTAEVAKTTIGVQETTDLRITFDPQAHPGLYGQLLRIVYLQTNDPEQPEVEIPITITIVPPEEDAP